MRLRRMPPGANKSSKPDYRRAWHPGGTHFFTINALQRRGNDLLTRHIDLLREAVRHVRRAHPFVIHGWVVLPDHLHCVIELPPGDSDFAMRLRLIKGGYSKRLPSTGLPAFQPPETRLRIKGGRLA
jgi:putative transposase